MNKELLISQVRTFVPYMVSALVTWLGSKGVVLDHNAITALEALVMSLTTLAVGFFYYTTARILETYVSPKFGWLLGYAKMPVYTVKPKLPSDLPDNAMGPVTTTTMSAESADLGDTTVSSDAPLTDAK